MQQAPAPQQAPPAAAARAPEFSTGYQRYALVLLLVVYIFNFVDRQIVNILIEGIKEDFHLSDWQLGFFGGTAFGIFYATLGIPIARYADGHVRRNIIALALAVWSLMTALQGLAQNFLQIALARIGVGVGEAGCSPPAHSMIADYFPPERRATALSFYAAGIPIGGAIGLIAGGWIREALGWREAFIIVGLPGVLLALLVWLTLREPTRGYYDSPKPQSEAPKTAVKSRTVIKALARSPAFRHLGIAGALHAFYGYGAAAFAAPFYERLHHFTPGELGTWLGIISLTVGVAGTFLGGYFADRLVPRDLRWYSWVPALSTVFAVPFVFAYYLLPDRYLAMIIGTAPVVLVSNAYLGPTIAVTQRLVPQHWRAQASAVLLFVINIVGLGLGPTFVGLLSDLLAPYMGEDSIRYSLLVTVGGGAAWATVHYHWGAKTLREEVRANEERA